MEHGIKYIPLSLFTLFTAKLLILGASIQDAPILLILGLIASVYEIKYQTKIISELKTEMDQLRKSNLEIEKSISDIKTHVNGIKLGQNIKSVNLGNR